MEKTIIKKPNFFIVGAPKSGTTSMQHYLKQHPDIFMPEGKEIHYFGSDLHFRRYRHNKEEYYEEFSAAQHEQRIGEASVWYLYSKSAAVEISEFCPAAKIIIMLRNPVDMIYSLHSQFTYNGWENIADFRSALAAEKNRRKGIKIPDGPIFKEAYYYRDTAKFTCQVKRYFDAFGRKNVLVILFDKLKQDASEVYRETLQFLGVDPHFQPEFPVVNPNTNIRSGALRNFLKNPPEIARTIARLVLPRRSLRSKLKSGLLEFNTQYKQRQPMDPQLKRQLQDEFRPDVENLGRLIDCDLSHWLES